MKQLTPPEISAFTLSQDKKALLRRLQDAKYVLRDKYKRGFGKGKFDFENKRLIGNNGIVLQWRLREWPDHPISYINQQTSIGIVVALYIR